MQDQTRTIPRSHNADAPAVKRSLRSATRWLGKHAAQIDQINVYAKADRDTGENMHLTMRAALWEADRRSPSTVSALARAIAHGALMGARGDSGVILAQFLGGMAKALEGCEVLDASRFAAALASAANSSWQGIVKPMPGTILTVCQDCARVAIVAADDAATLPQVLEATALAAKDSVARTPRLLPVLREAGVVDAGALGFATLVEGLWRSCGGRRLASAGRRKTNAGGSAGPSTCPAVIAVASGAGLAGEFQRLGAAAVVPGGQTMNPSAAELLDCIEAADGAQVIVLPNNRNVVLAAKQAGELASAEVVVVPTTTMPQGIAALRSYRRDRDLDGNMQAMTAAAEGVRTVEITRAIRAVRLGDLDVRENDVIGLLDDRLVAAGGDYAEVALRSLDLARLPAHSRLSIYFGEGVSDEMSQALAAQVRLRLPLLHVTLASGGQPHYYYIFALE